MVPTDTSVVECLLDATESRRQPLHWSGTPIRRTSELNGIRLELFHLHPVRHSQLCLSLACEGYKVYIQQPTNTWTPGPFSRRPDDQRLARLFEALASAAGMTTARNCVLTRF